MGDRPVLPESEAHLVLPTKRPTCRTVRVRVLVPPTERPNLVIARPGKDMVVCGATPELIIATAQEHGDAAGSIQEGPVATVPRFNPDLGSGSVGAGQVVTPFPKTRTSLVLRASAATMTSSPGVPCTFRESPTIVAGSPSLVGTSPLRGMATSEVVPPGVPVRKLGAHNKIPQRTLASAARCRRREVAPMYVPRVPVECTRSVIGEHHHLPWDGQPCNCATELGKRKSC